MDVRHGRPVWVRPVDRGAVGDLADQQPLASGRRELPSAKSQSKSLSSSFATRTRHGLASNIAAVS
jgi:hypothetical protein